MKKLLLIGATVLLLAGCGTTNEVNKTTNEGTTYNYEGKRIVNPFKNDITIKNSATVVKEEGTYVLKETKYPKSDLNKEALEKVNYHSVPKSNLIPDRSKVEFSYKVVAEGTFPKDISITKNKIYYIHNADVFKTLERDFGFDQPYPPFSPYRDYYLFTYSNTCDFNVSSVTFSSHTKLNVSTNKNTSKSCGGERKFAIIETPEIAAKSYSVNGYSGKITELASDFLNSLK